MSNITKMGRGVTCDIGEGPLNTEDNWGEGSWEGMNLMNREDN